MNNRSIVIVANFFENNDTSRPFMAYNYFHKKGYSVKVYYALFSHSLKKNRLIEGMDFHPIKIKKYSNNISIKRIISHFDFARKVGKLLEKESPDIVYFNSPPNLLGIPLCRLKGQKNNKLIVDILDLWPEAFPFPKSIKWLFNMTGGVFLKQTREYVLKNVDMVITESNYFYQKMKLERFNLADVIHLKKMTPTTLSSSDNTSEELSISYIGNIGASYDFESLLTVLKEVQKKRIVSIEIIGEGNLKDWLLEKLNRLGINYKFHGATFDEAIKRQVIERSWFGYNGFKNSTEVALSYKSIEYFSFGTPILNSTKGDTYDLVEKHNVGINFSSFDLNALTSKLVNASRKEIQSYKENVLGVFEKKFSEASYFKEMDTLLEKLG